MREPIRDRGRLEHILESINNIYEFVENIELGQVVNDKIRYFAIPLRNEIDNFIPISFTSYLLPDKLATL